MVLRTVENSPVGIGEGDEGELLGAVQDQVLCHLTEVSGTHGGPEQELGWQKADTFVLGTKRKRLKIVSTWIFTYQQSPFGL